MKPKLTFLLSLLISEHKAAPMTGNHDLAKIIDAFKKDDQLVDQFGTQANLEYCDIPAYCGMWV